MALREIEDRLRILETKTTPTTTVPAGVVTAFAGTTPPEGSLLCHRQTPPPPVPAGVVPAFAGPTPPEGWLLCHGQTLPRTTYPTLFAAIGTTYGPGDGTTTFTLPNLRGRVPVGHDPTQPEFAAPGKIGGTKPHRHTEGDLAAAIGAVSGNTSLLGYQAGGTNPRGPATISAYTIVSAPGANADTRAMSHHTRIYGTTSPDTTLQPFLTLNFIIRT